MAARGPHCEFAVAPSLTFIGSRQLCAGGCPGRGPGRTCRWRGEGGGAVPAHRAGRAGGDNALRLSPLRWAHFTPGRARVLRRHRLRAPGCAGLRGAYAHPPPPARSLVVAPTVWPAVPCQSTLAHCDCIPGHEPSGPHPHRGLSPESHPLSLHLSWEAWSGAVTLGQTGMRVPESRC